MDKEKVICHCYRVTVQDIEDAIKNGATTFEQVQEKTSLGTGCGGCVDSAKLIIDELIVKNK